MTWISYFYIKKECKNLPTKEEHHRASLTRQTVCYHSLSPGHSVTSSLSWRQPGVVTLTGVPCEGPIHPREGLGSRGRPAAGVPGQWSKSGMVWLLHYRFSWPVIYFGHSSSFLSLLTLLLPYDYDLLFYFYFLHLSAFTRYYFLFISICCCRDVDMECCTAIKNTCSGYELCKRCWCCVMGWRKLWVCLRCLVWVWQWREWSVEWWNRWTVVRWDDLGTSWEWGRINLWKLCVREGCQGKTICEVTH